MIIQLIAILVAALLAVLFMFQNPHHVQMHFMAWQTKEFPLIALILVSTLTGVIVTAILSLKSNLQLNRRIKRLQSELNAMKNGSGDRAAERNPSTTTDKADEFETGAYSGRRRIP